VPLACFNYQQHQLGQPSGNRNAAPAHITDKKKGTK